MTGPATRTDLAACRRLLREGSRSFHAASLLLPAGVRDDAAAVYAWCRVADHAVDRSADPEQSLREVRSGLTRVYEGAPAGPLERAFAGAVRRHRIPVAVPRAMLQGFEWDLQGRRYETLGDSIDYCVRVGSTVGVMMSVLMGRRLPGTLASATRLGAAMQLTNIARDVGEDARAGRLYLPLAWLRERGVDPDEWLQRPAYDGSIGSAVERILKVADRLYASAWDGIDDLPPRCRPAIRAAALIYAEIGREVRRAGQDTVARRVWTGPVTKVRLLARAIRGRPGAWADTGPASEVRPESVDAVDLVDRRAASLIAATAKEAERSVEHGPSGGLP